MNILDTYLDYETWMLRYFIGRCRDITHEQMHQTFDIGQGSVYDTIGHIIRNLEAWTDLMRGSPIRRLPKFPEDIDACLKRFDAAMKDFTDCSQAIASANRLDDTYLDTLADPPLRKSLGGTILHVLTHTTGHRWELQHMLQRLGLTDLIEGDVQEWELRTQSSAR
jgi:uncharacterized damage-inducible protein DinB